MNNRDDQNQPNQMQQSTERNGGLEPNDSRNVTGASGQGVGAPGGADQQTGGERWGGQQQAQQTGQQDGGVEFDADPSLEQAGGEVEFDAQRQQSDSTMEQPQQFSDTTGQQGGGGDHARFAEQIREHMTVIGADGAKVGTVDAIEGDKIKLTKDSAGMGSHEGHHHYLPLSQVSGVEGDTVRLAASGATAYGMESES
jgi:hypothetical protein